MLSSFVFQVAARMNRLAAPMMRRVEANILDLLGAVLNARARPGSTSRAGQLARIKVYIGEHLHERQLGPGTIAAALRLSTRYVHSVFEGEDIDRRRLHPTLSARGLPRDRSNRPGRPCP